MGIHCIWDLGELTKKQIYSIMFLRVSYAVESLTSFRKVRASQSRVAANGSRGRLRDSATEIYRQVWNFVLDFGKGGKAR